MTSSPEPAEDLVDLGAVSVETKGLQVGWDFDMLAQKRDMPGLSNN